MPSIVTHHLFGKDVYHNLNTELKNSLKESLDIYYIFTQSFDNLFYYKLLNPLKGKEIRKLGHTAQKEKVNLYFKNILDYIKENKLENKKEILAYLYGSICHYTLDSITHPYIIYHTGETKQNKKYRGLHEKMEVNIDAYMLKEKENKILRTEQLANILLPKTIFSNDLKQCLNEVFFNTFNFSNLGNIYHKSVNYGNFLLKYFVTDKTGLKKQIYKIKDFINPNSNRTYANLSFYIKSINLDYLNLNHETWYYPINNDIHHESFIDLYEIALKKATYTIETIHLYLKNKISYQEVLTIIGNNSYVTGIDCNIKDAMKTFKF